MLSLPSGECLRVSTSAAQEAMEMPECDSFEACPRERFEAAEGALPPLRLFHEFLIGVVEDLVPPGASVLDFGCGKGDIVLELLRRGWHCRGVELFGSGSGTNIAQSLIERGLLGNAVLQYDGETLPFEGDIFDVVISNQVFEHVPDLATSLNEIWRVLKPGGWLVCSFPSKDAIREAHCNVPFVHWMPKSRARFLWLLAVRSLGIGRLKGRRSRSQWAHFFNEWLEENTYYLSRKEINARFQEVFGNVKYFEEQNVRFRLRHSKLGRWATLDNSRLATVAFRAIGRNFGSLCILAQKDSRSQRTAVCDNGTSSH
jgi:SAM-dependent methyltransferase